MLPRSHGKESGRVDVAVVGDEQDALAVAGRGGVRARARRRGSEELAEPPGQVPCTARRRAAGRPARRCGDDPAEERCLDGADDEAVMRRRRRGSGRRPRVRRVSPPLPRRPGRRAPGRRPPRCARRSRPSGRRCRRAPEAFARMTVVLTCTVRPAPTQRTDGALRRVEVAVDAAHAVVRGGLRAVEADRDGLDAAAARSCRSCRWVSSGVTDGDRPTGTPREAACSSEVEQVRPEQAVTAGQDEDRVGATESGHLVDEVEALGPVQFPGQRRGVAEARQCRQASRQARVVSQNTSMGRCAKSGMCRGADPGPAACRAPTGRVAAAGRRAAHCPAGSLIFAAACAIPTPRPRHHRPPHDPPRACRT